MSQSKNNPRDQLIKAIALPAVLIGVIILAGLLAISYAGSGGQSSQDAAAQSGDSEQQVLQGKYDALGVSYGDPDAPVTVREFGDYQCPACGHFEPTAQRIRKEYGDSGKVRFVFFDFPLSMHSNARPAAIAARCAARQGKFWPYHDHLYQTQSKWAEKSDPASDFLDIGLESGVDLDKLKACMADKKPLKTIEQEKKAGEAIKLRATPTILVGQNERFVGVASYDKVNKAIQDALAHSAKKSGS